MHFNIKKIKQKIYQKPMKFRIKPKVVPLPLNKNVKNNVSIRDLNISL